MATWGCGESRLCAAQRRSPGYAWQLGWCEDCAGLATVENLDPDERLKDLTEAKAEFDAHPARPMRWWQLHKFMLNGAWQKRIEALGETVAAKPEQVAQETSQAPSQKSETKATPGTLNIAVQDQTKHAIQSENVPESSTTAPEVSTTRPPVAESQAPSISEQGDAGTGKAGAIIARVGTTPKNAEPVTVRDGVVFVGEYPAQNFKTGDDVTVPAGASFEQVKNALLESGALSNRQRVYAGEKGLRQAPRAKLPRQPEKQKFLYVPNVRGKSVLDTQDPTEYGEGARRTFLNTIKQLGGINVNQAKDITGENALKASRQSPGLFKRDGNGIDILAKLLHERGYLSDEAYNDVDGGVQAARDLVRQALNMEPVLTTEQADTLADLEAKAADMAEDMPAGEEALADMIVDKTEEADIPFLEGGTKDIATQMRNLGFTEDEINEELAREQANAAEHPATAESAAAGQSQEGDRTGQVEGQDQGFALASQTQAELKAKEQGQTKAEQADIPNQPSQGLQSPETPNQGGTQNDQSGTPETRNTAGQAASGAAETKVGAAEEREQREAEYRAKLVRTEGDERSVELGLKAQAVVDRIGQAVSSKNEALEKQRNGELAQRPERKSYCFLLSAEAAAADVGNMVIGIDEDSFLSMTRFEKFSRTG